MMGKEERDVAAAADKYIKAADRLREMSRYGRVTVSDALAVSEASDELTRAQRRRKKK